MLTSPEEMRQIQRDYPAGQGLSPDPRSQLSEECSGLHAGLSPVEVSRKGESWGRKAICTQ